MAILAVRDALFSESGGAQVFSAELSEPSSQVVTLGFRTEGIEAVAGRDFAHVEDTISFEPGQTRRDITVSVLPDALNEGPEGLQLVLTSVQNAELAGNRAFAAIEDDDPLPTLSVADVTVVEGNRATTSAAFLVTMSAESGRRVSVKYATGDFDGIQPAVGVLVFEPGDTSKSLVVPVKADLLEEPTQTFRLQLSAPQHATLDRASATGTILNDDVQLLATGAGFGGGPHVCLVDPRTGEERMGFFAYAPAFTGGVRVAAADVSGDGYPDLITAAGVDGGPHVKVFDGRTGDALSGRIGNFFAYAPSFTGGVQVAAADLDFDGYADVVTAAGEGGGPHVRAFSGRDGSVMMDLFVFDPSFTGGVNIALADLNGDGVLDLIAGCGAGGPPEVRVFDLRTHEQMAGPVGSFLAYDRAFTGGVFVAAGDLDGDRQADIITGASIGGGPHVRAFDGATARQLDHPLANFMAFDARFRGGARVSMANIDGDRYSDLVVAAGPVQEGPNAPDERRVRTFRGATGEQIASFHPYTAAFPGGSFAGGYAPPQPLGALVDPLEVFDANDALVLSPERVEHEIGQWTVDLRAQLYGAIAVSYDWDLSGAADALNISGDTTARLEFEWDDVMAPSTNTIVLTVTDDQMQQHQATYTFEVLPNNQIDQLTTAATWPEVMLPDRLQAAQEMVYGPTYALSLASGAVYTTHSFPTYNAPVAGMVGEFGRAAPSLVYSSLAADARPIFIDHFEIDPTAMAAPPKVSAKLTLNSVAGTEVFYDTSLLNPGNILQIALQADATGLSTGRYEWEIEITSHYTTPVTVMRSGEVNIINHANSPIGKGWSLAGVHRLHEVTGGVILEMEAGASLWFEEDGMGGYLMPPGDTSMLMKNMDDTFTRTLKDGTKIHFDEDGFQTEIVDRNENSITFGYTGSLLTSVTDAVGLVTDLDYSSGLLLLVTDPAGREFDVGHDMSGRLTTITDADNALWEFGYTAAHRLEEIVDPRENSTAFAYNFAGRASVVTRADDSEEELVAHQMEGLVPPMQGTSMNPIAPTLAVEAMAQYTDPRGQLWQTRMDWFGFGRAVQTIDPLENQVDIHRDGCAYPWLVSDELERRTRSEFDMLGNPLQVWLPDDNLLSMEYNAFSQVTQSTDAAGYFTRYTFDSDGNLEELILADDDDLDMMPNLDNNPKYVFTYDTAGNRLTATDPEGYLTSFEYNMLNQLELVTEPDDDMNAMNNPQIALAYDDAGNVESRTDQLGFVTTFDFDPMNRLLEMVLPDDDMDPMNNPVYAYSYDAIGNMTGMTDPLSNTTSYTFDPLNRPLTITNALDETTTLGYDDAGNLTSSTDPLDRTTSWTFDAAGRRTAETNALDETVTTGYDAAGQVTSVVDALDRTTSMEYNERGWMTKTTYASGQYMAYTYDARGNLTGQQQHISGGYSYGLGLESVWIGIGATFGGCYFTYDARNNRTSTADYLGNTTYIAYNGLNLPVQITGPTTASGTPVTTITYNAKGQVAEQEDPLGHTVVWAYDKKGQVTSITASPPTTYDYDAQGRVILVTDQEGGETAYGYDLAGRLVSLTDPEGNETTYEYDDANRLITRIDPLLNETSYSYDDAGQLVEMIDRNGRKTQYEYDDAGRRTAEIWLDAMDMPIRTIAYAFDAAGQMISADDADSVYAFTYYDAGLLATVDNDGTPNVPNVVLTYGYHYDFQRGQVEDNLGITLDIGYDMSRRPSQLDWTNGSVSTSIGFEFDEASRIVEINRDADVTGGVIQTLLEYDLADRVTSIEHLIPGGATFSAFAYMYNLEGELTDYSGPDGDLEFAYDETHQLIDVMGDRSESYSYDTNGNRTESHLHSDDYVTGDNNQLLSDGVYDYGYDNEGNRISKEHIGTGVLTVYGWDHRNRLTSVTTTDAMSNVLMEATFVYDVFDRLIGRIVDADGDGMGAAEELWTVYDGIHAWADFDDVGDLLNHYLYGPAVDMIMARISPADDISYHLTDHLGSTRQNVSFDGTILNEIDYDAFGNILNETSPSSGDRFKFTAREWEAAVELVHSRARWLDTETGRFLSEDPIEFLAGDTNLFRYVFNSPSTLIDPTGLVTPNPSQPWVEQLIRVSEAIWGPGRPYSGGQRWGDPIPPWTFGTWPIEDFIESQVGTRPADVTRVKNGCYGVCQWRLETEVYPHLFPGVKCYTSYDEAMEEYKRQGVANGDPLFFIIDAGMPIDPLVINEGLLDADGNPMRVEYIDYGPNTTRIDPRRVNLQLPNLAAGAAGFDYIAFYQLRCNGRVFNIWEHATGGITTGTRPASITRDEVRPPPTPFSIYCVAPKGGTPPPRRK